MQRRKLRDRKRGRGVPRRARESSRIDHIPQTPARRPQTLKVRYEFLSAELDTVNGSTLLNAVVMAISATATYRIFGAVKLKLIEMWAAGNISSTATAQSQIGIEWFGTTNSFTDSVQLIDTTLGTCPAHIRTSPPKKSSSAMWINQGGTFDTTDTIFSINAPLGAVVDVTLNYVVVDSEAASAGPTTTGMTAGTVYYNYLDGRSSGNISPVTGYRKIT